MNEVTSKDGTCIAERRTLEGQTHDVAPEVLTPVVEAFFVGDVEIPGSSPFVEDEP
jgi:hypothetical protein